MVKKIIKIIFFVLIIWPTGVQAAFLYLENTSNQTIVGHDVVLQVKLDTQGQDINTLEGNLFLPSDLKVADVYDNNSLISLWVDKPTNNDGIIHFSGIMPGGFIGSGNLFKLVVQSSMASVQNFAFADAQAYLNDGLGTKVDIGSQNFSLDFIVSDPEQGVEGKIRDNIAPENFVPIIKRLDQIESGVFFLIFETQDKGEGIDYYEVREGLGSFVLVTSPYRLQNQNLDEDIYVKAVDRAGNERLVKVPAFYPKYFYEKYEFYVIIILGLVFLWLMRKKLLDHMKNANKNQKHNI